MAYSTTKSVGKKRFFELLSKGHSMEPVLGPGDVVIYKKCSFPDINVNDFILISKRNIFFTHRVIYKANHYIITKGDNNFDSDGKVFPKNIIAKAIRIKRGNKEFSLADLYLVQSKAYWNELQKIHTLFTTSHIQYLFLKGLPLHLYYEKSIPKRLYADCDILITKQEKKKVDMLLNVLGFHKEKGGHSDHLKHFLNPDFKEIRYLKKTKSCHVIIDIHYEISFLTRKVELPIQEIQKKIMLMTNDVLKRRKKVSIYGLSKIPVLQNEDLILYLFLHFFSDNWTGIYKLYLIDTVVKKLKNTIDWALIYERASTYNVFQYIVPGLYLYSKYFHNTTPLRYAQKHSSKMAAYSMRMFKLWYKKSMLFNNYSSMISFRFTKAFYIVMFYDKSWIEKLKIILNPKLLLHFIYFSLYSIRLVFKRLLHLTVADTNQFI